MPPILQQHLIAWPPFAETKGAMGRLNSYFDEHYQSRRRPQDWSIQKLPLS